MDLLAFEGCFESTQLLGHDSPRFLVLTVTDAEGCNRPDSSFIVYFKDHSVRSTNVRWEIPFEDMPPGMGLVGINPGGMGFAKYPLYKFWTYLRTLCLVLAEMGTRLTVPADFHLNLGLNCKTI